MLPTNVVYIGLGSNLGNRLENLEKAYSLIEQNIGKIEKKSSVYVSPPWGFEAKEDFYNSVIKLKTQLDPYSIMIILQKIEIGMGRVKSTGENYESRIIDLDIIDFGGLLVNIKDLVLPHPQMHLRKFVLIPLNEIEPIWIHPIFKLSAIELLKRIRTDDFIEKI